MPEEVIAEDYACTADAEAAAMLNAMRHVRTAYRTTENYLRTIAVTVPRIAATRTRLRTKTAEGGASIRR